MRMTSFARRLVCAALALAVCAAAFGGCAAGGDTPADSASTGSTGSTGSGMPSIAVMEPWRTEGVGGWPSRVDEVHIYGDRLFCCGLVADGGEHTGSYLLYSARVDGTDAAEAYITDLPSMVGENEKLQYGLIYTMVPTADDTFWMLQREVFTTGADETGARFSLHRIAPDGTVAESRVLPLEETLEQNIWQIAVTGEAVWMAGVDYLLRWDPAEKTDAAAYRSFALPGDDVFIEGMQPLDDGGLLVRMYVSGQAPGAGNTRQYILQPDGSWDGPYTLPQEMENGIPGAKLVLTDTTPHGAEALFWNSRGMYRWDIASGAVTQLFSWLASGVRAADILNIYALPEDRYAVSLNTDTGSSLLQMTYMDAETLAGRTPLQVGVVGMPANNIEQAVNLFNIANTEAYVEIRDYGMYEIPEEVLIQDLVNNTAPDVLFLAPGVSNNIYIRAGAFIDMYPLLDADPELDREDLVASVLRACTFDGALYTIAPGYRVMTLAGAEDMVGAGTGWTWKEYQALTAAYPQITSPIFAYERGTILHWFVQMGGSRFFDAAAGKAYFDTPDFVSALTACAGYTAEMPDVIYVNDARASIDAGEALLCVEYLQSFHDIHTIEHDLGGPVALKGFPSDEGGSGSAIMPSMRLAITSTCADPALAWQFVRSYLMPAFQNGLAPTHINEYVGALFPIRRDALAAAATAALLPLGGGGNNYQEAACTQEQTQQIIDLIEATDVLYQYDDVLYTVLTEESEACWAGAHTAAEAAAIIQDRLQRYLDEQA